MYFLTDTYDLFQTTTRSFHITLTVVRVNPSLLIAVHFWQSTVNICLTFPIRILYISLAC